MLMQAPELQERRAGAEVERALGSPRPCAPAPGRSLCLLHTEVWKPTFSHRLRLSAALARTSGHSHGRHSRGLTGAKVSGNQGSRCPIHRAGSPK